MPGDDAAAKSGGAVELPTNNGLVTRIREVEVDDWEHGMVDDPLGYVALRAPDGLLAPPAATGGAAVRALHAAGGSGEVVEVAGEVRKTLSDDLEGSRHQRFILDVGEGATVLVSHNIDLAPRIDGLRAGDRVSLRGQYEWNEKGGVIHWTHHDPGGRRPGGYIEHEGRTYR